MEDILYDCYLAEEIIRQSGGDSLSQLSFKANILMQHGVTEKDFDESMKYYTRHTEELHKIYESLATRFTDESVAQGASANEMSRFGNLSSSSDTTDIMTGNKSIFLFAHPAFNRHLFAIKADTAFHRGDRFIMDFDTRYIYQDGMRSSVVTLAVRLGNDSVASRTIQVSSASHYNLQVEDKERHGIKEVKGYFMLNDNSHSSGTTTMRMMAITGIRLIRMHVKQDSVLNTDNQPKNASDSLTEPIRRVERSKINMDNGKPLTPNAIPTTDRRLVPKDYKIQRIKK